MFIKYCFSIANYEIVHGEEKAKNYAANNVKKSGPDYTATSPRENPNTDWRTQNRLNAQREAGAGKSGTTTLQTGGRQIDYNAYIKRLETIDMEYENIRIDTTDISKIAQNTGMPEWKISRIKDHVFSNEHILDAGVKRFDADPEIADAWYRLTNGTYNQNDIDLLNHEYFESKFESFYKTDYRTAYNKTEESGRIWDPYKENN